MAINQDHRKSVYITEEDKTLNAHYVATREIIEGFSKTKNILEFAGGPLNSTGPLTNLGYHVTTIDLDQGLLNYSHDKYKNITVIKANLENGMPKVPGLNKYDVVVALDILEHLSRENAVKLLAELMEAKKGDDFIVIITMPIIDFSKVTTWYEFMYIPFHLGKRPPKGLFDRTHKILTSQMGCKKIFSDAGYQLLNEYATNSFTGITGKWKTFDYNKLPWKLHIQTKVLIFVSTFISFLIHPFSRSKRRKSQLRLTEHRGFFVIRPDWN